MQSEQKSDLCIDFRVDDVNNIANRVTFATEKMAPRFGDLFNFEKPYLLNRWAHSAQQINKVY